MPHSPDEVKPGQFIPFAGATGRGVRVAVIDSGVHARHPHIHRVAGGAAVDMDGGVEEGIFTDVMGHGTAVMAAIQEKAPNADYYAVRIFGESLRTNAIALRAAMEWCVEREMDVVNLSLGTLNVAHAERFAETVERARRAGVLLVAARESDGKPCYPGCLPGVFGVEVDWECPRHLYRFTTAKLVASGYPRTVPGVPPERNLNGISFAVANASGFVAQACETLGAREPVVGRAARMTAALAAEAIFCI